MIAARTRVARGRTVGLTAAAGALAFVLVPIATGPAARALPPGGAGPDTAGTQGTVSPSTLQPGERLSFSVSGFPAGEVVSVQIDDGEFCSVKGQRGPCVVHQQKAGKNGAVRGSFALPDGVKPGSHWLRFLASAEMVDDAGKDVGVKSYSLRGNTDFVVRAAGSGTGGSTEASQSRGAATGTSESSGTGQPGAQGAGSGSGSGTTAATDGASGAGAAGGATGTVPGATTPRVTDPAAPAAGQGATPGSTTATDGSGPPLPGAAPATGGEAVAGQPEALRIPALPASAETVAAPAEEPRVPWVGVGILAVSLLLCGGLLTALRLGRRV